MANPIDPHSGAETLVEIAVQDLAERLGIPTDQIALVHYEEVVWPNSAMGCPHPDMRYTQVPQDGVLIKLSAVGEVYEYHGGGGRDPFLCEQPVSNKDYDAGLDLDDFATQPSMDQ